MKNLLGKLRSHKLLTCMVLLLMLSVAGALGGYKLYRVHYCNQRALLIGFDDYNAVYWEPYFDLFDQYGAKVTFFINAADPTDFCYNAIERGHEIGYHGEGHLDMTSLTDEEFYEEAIEPIQEFRDAGIELTTFAYPYGYHNDETDALLQQYYTTLRGAYEFDVKYKFQLSDGFIDSYSLDNIHFESDEAFQEKVTYLLDLLLEQPDGTAASVFSHAIGDGKWCIRAERLEFLLQEAQKRDIRMCTFREIEDNF